MEYLKVLFSENREVIIDSLNSGQFTGEVIEVEAGHHIISLGGDQNFVPGEIKVTLKGSSVLDPEEVRFEKE